MNNTKTLDQKLNNIVSLWLRTGVLLSVGIIIIGFVVGFVKQDLLLSNIFHFENNEGKDLLIEFFKNFSFQKSISLIQLGIFIMILTPILRLIMACIGYLYEKDYLYTFISLLVLGIIAISFFFGLKG